MEKTIFRYLFRYSLKAQIALLVLTLISFPFLYASLDLPKTIINDAIGASDFPREYFGYTVDQIPYLFILCAAFLALVFVNGAFKYYVNVFKGRLGEGMLRRLRYELYGRILRFPLPHFRKTSQGEVVSMITAEVEPLGGFIGDAIALPAFQGGTLLVILLFVFVQDWIMGLAAIALYPLQMYLIPKLQKQVNALGKRRVLAVRKLSEKIGESVTGVQEIHANDTSEFERADMSSRLGVIYEIRYEIYRRKFIIKFLNNFIAQVTPFFFYSIGGYLVITTEEFTFGALVAVIAAYKDLASPWKELLTYYQRKEDARIKYEQLIDQFQPPGMLDTELQQPDEAPAAALQGPIIATNLTLEEEGGIKVVDGATFTLDLSQKTAIVGPSGSGRVALVRLLARLIAPTAGAVSINGRNLNLLPESQVGRRIAYVDQAAHLFTGTVSDNLLYGLKHRPLRQADYDPEAAARQIRDAADAAAAGNTTSDLGADWIDYEEAGVSGPEGLGERVLEVLDRVGLHTDIYDFGLQGTIDVAHHPELSNRILEARGVLRERLADPAYEGLVESFNKEAYITNMTVAENLLFGYPRGTEFDLDHLGENAHVLSVLEKAGLTEQFVDTGLRLAGIMVELFLDLPPDHEYFERFSFISADELPDFQQLARRAAASGTEKLDDDDRSMLISLPFKLIPGRHRLGLIEEEMQQRILSARKMFAETLPEGSRGSVAFLDEGEYNVAASVQDNILFGRLVYGRQQARQEVGVLIREVIESLDLLRVILDLGLESHVGIAGSRLSVTQRQKIAIARCLLKRPDLMIVDDATSALDPSSQSAIMDSLFKEFEGRGLVWVLSRVEQAERFDRTLVMDAGKIAEQGKYEDLSQPGNRLHAMIAGD